MKMTEIMLLLIIFNAMMAIFGSIGLKPFSLGDAGMITVLVGCVAGLATLLGTAYFSTYILGNTNSPMFVVFSVYAVISQLVYVTSWFTFWGPLSGLSPTLDLFSALFVGLIEVVFAFGLIQMATGGWEGFK